MAQLKNRLLRAVFVLCLGVSSVFAAPFEKTFTFTQPDGTAIQLWGKGNEFYAVFETLDGFTVMFDQTRRAYVYATLSNDGTTLLPSAMEVGKGDPRTIGLAQHIRMTQAAVNQQVAARYTAWDASTRNSRRWQDLKAARHTAESLQADGRTTLAPPSFTTIGTKVGLCLLIDFENDPATIPQASIDDFCNGDSYTGFGNNGSVKKYFLDNSNNQLTYINVVTAYIRIPNSLHPKSYYNDTTKDCGTQARKLINDAVTIMKALPNYTSEILPTFDALTLHGDNSIVACNVFYAGDNGGVWTYGLWPHSWSLAFPLELSAGGAAIYDYQVTNIGDSLEIATFCHENGHMLCGFPDIYDYGYDSSGGAGLFSLMNSGTFFGKNPCQVDAYLKTAAGWSTIVDLTRYSTEMATVMSDLGSSDFNKFYRFKKPGSTTEYYLFENRQKAGRDANIPASGLAIWHVDELGNRDDQRLAYNTSHQNYELTLVQADDQWDLEHGANNGDANDLYYLGNPSSGYMNAFNDSSSPSAKWWDGTKSSIEVSSISASGPVMTFAIMPKPPVMLTTGALPDGYVGNYYEYTLSAVRGVSPYTWSIIAGTLPSGLSLAPATGVISGMPDTATTANFSVVVTGDNNVAATNQFSLTVHPVRATPFAEPFENAGLLPGGWTQEFVTNSVSWIFLNGGTKGHPSSAHGGGYNAGFAVTTTNKTVTRLVSPCIDFGPRPHAAVLTFWHYMEEYVGQQDELRIYYKTNYASAWMPLQTFKASVTQWRQQTVTLPDPNRTYYVAFEGTAQFGYGVYVDDVAVYDPTPALGFSNSTALTDAVINIPYSNTVQAVGGVPPYNITLTAGSLPDGMSISSNGTITGTASVTGVSSFDLTVQDSWGDTATVSFTLAVVLPTVELFSENFEHGGLIPTGWTQEYVTNAVNWVCQYGGGDLYNFHQPPSAHGGGFNMTLWKASHDDNKTRLVTPPINLGFAPPDCRLTFWHCMAALSSNQDELRVYYKTSATGTWNLLATYTSSVSDWTKRTLALPNLSGTYYLAFEGNAKFGNGVCIDDVRIANDASAPIITTTSPLPSGLLNTAYSQPLAAIGGVEPYTWSIVSNSLPAGLTLSSDGVISGTPGETASSTFLVRVSGGDGYASTNLFTLSITQIPGYPYAETFEHNGNWPFGWTQEKVLGNVDWVFRSGSPAKIPLTAHSGTYNACFYYEDNSSYKISKLVSPMIDLGSGTTNTKISFWLCMASYVGNMDRLRVYYKTSASGSWNQIAQFTQEIKAWTNIVLTLPNPSPTYYVAFEGWASFGRGVCIDDVVVSGDLSPYNTWKTQNFTQQQLADGFITKDLDDPDGDGIPNALEYAMGLDPNVYGTDGTPTGGIMTDKLYITYRKNKLATDVRFEIAGNTNLLQTADWNTNNITQVVRTDDSNLWWQVFGWHNVPVTNAPQRFLRLQIYMP